MLKYSGENVAKNKGQSGNTTKISGKGTGDRRNKELF